MEESILVSKIKEQEMEIQKLSFCNKALSTMYDSVRGIKHDFFNFVQALNGYVQLDDMEGVRNMMLSVIGECKKINVAEFMYQEAIQNPAICNIIYHKFYLAKEKHVKMNIDITTNLQESSKNIYALCRILSILLDNAIEAASESEEKIVNFQLFSEYGIKRKVIIIENSYHNKEVDLVRIFEKGYSSKSCNLNEHGIGLWNVKQTLSQNNHLKLSTTKGKMFQQRLEIDC
ncbi:MAG: GHKL domain-containing protein [Clostridia bacterium]|nr:GHKL domain-containing protein [Clostridia bacterium]